MSDMEAIVFSYYQITHNGRILKPNSAISRKKVVCALLTPCALPQIPSDLETSATGIE